MIRNSFVIEDMVNSMRQRMGDQTSGDTSFANYSLPDMAAECVKMNGGQIAGVNKNTVLSQALSSSDFPGLLSGTVNKTVLKKYPQIPATFTRIADQGRLPDFRQGSVIRITHAGVFEKIGAGGEILPLGYTVDGVEPAQVESYGGIVSLSRRAVVDDDLSVLKDMGTYLARTGKRTQNIVVCRFLLENPSLDDGTPLFDASRSNLLTGAGSALSKDSLATAMKTLRLMGDDDGNPYGIEPAVLLVPPALEETAAELCRNISEAGRDRLELVVEPLLEASYLTGGSSTAWYLLPDPEICPVIRTLSIEGQQPAPYLGEMVAFNSDEIEFKGILDWGVTAVSSKGIRAVGQ